MAAIPYPHNPEWYDGPPSVVLCAELHVGAQHSNLGIDDDREHADEEHKAKEVVKVAKPQGSHGKVELDENGAKGENASCSKRTGDLKFRLEWNEYTTS